MAETDARRPRAATKDELVFVALGGLGEIGMNVYLYGLGRPDAREWLMIDLGITFPHDTEPGADVVLPDLRFIEAERSSLKGLLLTHAHEDHIGAVIELWPRIKCPIYATPFTAGMLQAKLVENGNRVKLPINIVRLGSRFNIGPFDLELVTLAHSIPEPSGVAIRTPHGLVFHTGDWKLDATPLVGDPSNDRRLQALGEEGVDAIVCDSTNAMRQGRSPSEVEVAQSITEIIRKAKRRVAVTTFASNVARLKAVGDAARATGRQLVVSGRAMHRVIQVAKDTGYLPEDFVALDQEHFGYLEPREVVALVTGSQGEPRAAMARIADDSHPQISLGRGDLVIFSSRAIPGNEKAIGRIQNGLARLGCDVITDADALVHVTGHPRREELKQMYAWLKPALAIPMHGEARHLAEHAKLAKEAGVGQVQVITDGEMIRVAPAPAMIVDEVPVGRFYRDGRLIVPAEGGPVRERRRLSFAGIVSVAIALDKRGEVVADPEVDVDGIPDETAEGRAMEDIVLSAVDGTIDSMPASRRRDVERVRDAVRRAVRAAVDQVWGKKPIVKVLICRV
jgi:ribonuclease J